MGEQNVRHNTDEATRQAFMKSLLDEVQALELMLEKGMIESGKRRIGAEQEMFLINHGYKPTLCLLYTSPSPRDVEESRMPSSA